MQRLLTRITPIIFSSVLALAGTAACGGDDDGDDGADGTDDGDDDGDDDDGGDAPDAGAPDAAGPTVVRGGTVAITETAVTNDLPAPTSGGVVSISFLDLETATVAPVEGFEQSVGGCQIFVYDVAAGETEPTAVDEGPITVSGTANGDIVCAFSAAQGEYVCQSTDAPSAAGSAAGAALDGAVPTSTLIVQGSVLNESAVVGSQLLLNGFGDPTIDGQLFPVTDRPANSTFQISTPAGLPENVTGPKGSTYATFVGAGPIPNPGGLYNFLLPKTEITVSKGDSDLVASFEQTYTPEGEGFVLLDDPKGGSYLPHEIPTVVPAAGDVTFECVGEDCGDVGAGGELYAMVINGVTTDAELPSAKEDPFGIAMPDAVGSYATFTCGVPLMDAATLPAEALDVILGTNPTRVQTTVVRSRAALNVTPDSDTAETTVVVGHSYTGFTTVEAPPKLAR